MSTDPTPAALVARHHVEPPRVMDAELVSEQPAASGGAAAFDALLRDWLLGYSNPRTRLSYGDALGLDRDWVRDLGGRPATPTGATGAGRVAAPPRRVGRHRGLAWFRWCDRHRLHPLAATSTDVKRWQADMVTAEVRKTTRAHRLAVVGELYRYLVDAGAVPASPAAFDRAGLGLRTGADTSDTVVLTADQVDRLLLAAGRPRRGLHRLMARRAVAIVAIFTLGLRVAELAGLRRADLHRTRGRRALRVTGKGDKTRIVYLSRLAGDAIDAYLAERDRWAGTAVPARPGEVDPRQGPLIATRDGGHLDPRDIWALIRRVTRAAGPSFADVADRMGPHALRHFYVTAAAEAGADMTHVQADVGHASVDTTNRVYNRAARHPDRSAVDLVEDAILAARADRPDPAGTDPAADCLAALAGADPVEQLLALQHLQHRADHDPGPAGDAVDHLADLLRRPDLHPRVAAQAAALHAQLTRGTD
jgi:site-specific recombinase XerD